jgi:hypothetical protein
MTFLTFFLNEGNIITYKESVASAIRFVHVPLLRHTQLLNKSLSTRCLEALSTILISFLLLELEVTKTLLCNLCFYLFPTFPISLI